MTPPSSAKVHPHPQAHPPRGEPTSPYRLGHYLGPPFESELIPPLPPPHPVVPRKLQLLCLCSGLSSGSLGASHGGDPPPLPAPPPSGLLLSTPRSRSISRSAGTCCAPDASPEGQNRTQGLGPQARGSVLLHGPQRPVLLHSAPHLRHSALARGERGLAVPTLQVLRAGGSGAGTEGGDAGIKTGTRTESRGQTGARTGGQG